MSERGFVLLETVVAILMATLLATWAASAMVDRINDAAAEATAVWMLAAKQGVKNFLLKYSPLLHSATGPDALAAFGYDNWQSPSLTELRNDGLLSTGFPEKQGRGPGIVIQVLRDPACTEASCRIEALIHSDRALMRHGGNTPSEQMVAQWLLAARGWGGSVQANKPDRVAGAAFEFPNPPGPNAQRLAVGAVALALTVEELFGFDFLRVADTRDPQFQGTLTVKGDITSAGAIEVDQHFSIGARGHFGSGCDPDGKIVRAESGGLLVCHAGVWLWASGRGGGGYSVNTLTGCGADTRNPVTGECSCPAGFTVVRISNSGSFGDPGGITRGYLCVP